MLTFWYSMIERQALPLLPNAQGQDVIRGYGFFSAWGCRAEVLIRTLLRYQKHMGPPVELHENVVDSSERHL
jgi:hypothetical protein